MSFKAPPRATTASWGATRAPSPPCSPASPVSNPGMRVLDVGSGPGALTETLAGLVGAGHVAAAEPSPSFAAACAARVPGADVRQASAEDLPWEDGTFDAAVAQLVLHFMKDPLAGLREMQRVVKPGSVVAGCTWDTAGRMTLLGTFWEAALALDPSAPAERGRARLGRPEELRELGTSAGLDDVSVEPLDVSVTYLDFDDFWEPVHRGRGAHRGLLRIPRSRRAERPEGGMPAQAGQPGSPFEMPGRAWVLRGRRPA